MRFALYLQSQDQPTLDLYARWFSETEGTAAGKVRDLFSNFARATNTSRWKGCGFLRTTAELASTPVHPAIKVGAAHKKRFEAWLSAELHELGIAAAGAIARQIVILLDGAATVMLIHREVAYVEAAGALAAELVAAADARSRLWTSSLGSARQPRTAPRKAAGRAASASRARGRP